MNELCCFCHKTGSETAFWTATARGKRYYHEYAHLACLRKFLQGHLHRLVVLPTTTCPLCGKWGPEVGLVHQQDNQQLTSFHAKCLAQVLTPEGWPLLQLGGFV